MKFDKRIAALALAAVMTLGLTACRTDGLSADDAKKCVQVEMDTTYKGDFAGFVDFYSNVSTDDAKEQYDANIEGEVEYFFSIAGPADPEDTYNVVEPSEMQTYRAKQLYKDIYAKRDYTVASASKQDDGTFSVKVNVKPMDILTLVADNMSDHFAEFTAKYDALDLDSMSDEEFLNWYRTVYAPDYYDTLLSLLESQVPNIGYAEERSLVVQVQQSDDGALYISNDDLRNLDNLIIDYTGSTSTSND